MKKGIFQSCFPEDMPLERCLSLSQQAGIEGFELLVNKPGEGELHAESTPDDLRAIGRMAADKGLELCSLCGSPYTNQFPVTSPDAEVWRQGVRALERMLEIGNALEIPVLLFVAGRVWEGAPYDVAYERALAALQAAAPRADELGVTICVENVGNRFLQSPLEMRDFIAAAGSDRVRAYFDVGNILFLNQGWPEQWLRILGPLVRMVHVKDLKVSPRGMAGVMLLQGDLNWHAALQACRDIGYDGYLVAEVGHYPLYPERTPFDIGAPLDVLVAEYRQIAG